MPHALAECKAAEPAAPPAPPRTAGLAHDTTRPSRAADNNMATPCCAAFARGWPSCRADACLRCAPRGVARRDQRRAEASGRIQLAWPHKAARDNDGRMDGSLQHACVRCRPSKRATTTSRPSRSCCSSSASRARKASRPRYECCMIHGTCCMALYSFFMTPRALSIPEVAFALSACACT